MLARVQLLDPARGLVAAADTDEAPLLDACVACNALCRQMKLEDLQRAAGGPTVARFAVAVAQAAIACVEQGGATVEMATEWQGEATSAQRASPLSMRLASVACMRRL